MSRGAPVKRVGDLITLLGQLRVLNERLLKIVRAKLTAMKRADLPEMRRLNEQELALAKRMQERSGLRRQLMGLIGRQFGMPVGEARSLTMSQLSSYVTEPERSELLVATKALKTLVSNLAQANRVAGASTREILNHLRWISGAVRPQAEQPAGYSGDGGLVSPSGTMIFETLG